MKYSLGRVAAMALVVGSSVLFGVVPAQAQVASDYYWIGTDGYWSDGSNWSPEGPPPYGDDALPSINIYLTQSDTTNRTVTLNSPVDLNNDPVTIDATGSGTMTLAIQEGAAGDIDAIRVGTATINQTGGHLYLGFGGEGVTINNGTYNLSGGQVGSSCSIDGRLVLNGSSTFNQTGGESQGWGDIIVSPNAVYNLHGGTASSSHSIIIDGVFNQTGGNVSTDLGQFCLAGTYNLGNGSLHVGSWTNDRSEISGTMNQTGGHWDSRYTTITSGGTYNLSDGSFRGESVINAGTIRYSGGAFRVEKTEEVYSPYVRGTLVNSGTVNLTGRGTRTIEGDVINTGTFKTTNTSAVYTGTFTNHGAYLSDPASQRFNDLFIGQTGYLQGGLADLFFVGGDFLNHSTRATAWNTSLAYLGFVDGSDALHDVYFTGADYGATRAGYKNNFSWGVLDLLGDDLRLYDGNELAGGALYVGGIWGLEITDRLVTNITGMDGLNLYYWANLPGNAYLHGGTYDLTGGGHLIPITTVPEPATLLLLGTGLVGLGGVARWRRARG